MSGDAAVSGFYSQNNRYIGRNSTVSASFFSSQYDDTYENDYAGVTYIPVNLFGPKQFEYMKKAFEFESPFGLRENSGLSGYSSGLSDLLGRQHDIFKSTSTDMGPYQINNSSEKYESDYYNIAAPGIFFEYGGEKQFDFYASSGTFSVSAYAKK